MIKNRIGNTNKITFNEVWTDLQANKEYFNELKCDLKTEHRCKQSLSKLLNKYVNKEFLNKMISRTGEEYVVGDKWGKCTRKYSPESEKKINESNTLQKGDEYNPEDDEYNPEDDDAEYTNTTEDNWNTYDDPTMTNFIWNWCNDPKNSLK